MLQIFLLKNWPIIYVMNGTGGTKIFLKEGEYDPKRRTDSIQDSTLKNRVIQCHSKVGAFMARAFGKLSQSAVSYYCQYQVVCNRQYMETTTILKRFPRNPMLHCWLQPFTTFAVLKASSRYYVHLRAGDLLVGRGDLVHAGCA